MASLGELTVRAILDIVDFINPMSKAEQAAQSFGKNVKEGAEGGASALGSLGDAASLVGSALTTLGVAMTATAMADFVIDTNAAIAAFEKLALTTGNSVEDISALAPAARLSGTSMEEVAGSTAKFEKNLVGVIDGTGPAAKGFAALGLTADDAAKMLANPAEGLLTLAQRLADFADDGNKVAVVMEIMGKGGANLLPFFKELGEQTDLVATKTTEEVTQARDFERALSNLSVASASLKNHFVEELTPSLTDLINAFLNVGNQAGGFKDQINNFLTGGSIAEWMYNAVDAAAEFADALTDEIGVLHLMGAEVGLVIIGGLTFIRLLADLALAIVDPVAAFHDAQAATKIFSDALDNVKDEYNKSAEPSHAFQDSLHATEQAHRDATVAAGGHKDALAAVSEQSKQTDKDFQAFSQSMQKQATDAENELDALGDGTKMVPAQQAFDELRDSDKWAKFSQAQKDAATDEAQHAVQLQNAVVQAKAFWTEMDTLKGKADDANLELAQLLDDEKWTPTQTAFAKFTDSKAWADLNDQQKATEMAQAAITIEAEKTVAQAKAYKEEQVKIQKEYDTQKDHLDQFVKKIDEQTASIGASDAQQQLMNADLEAQKEGLVPLSDAWNDFMGKVEASYTALDEAKTMQKSLDDQKKLFADTYDEISKGITDTMTNAFDDIFSGAGFSAKKFTDDLKKMFDNLVLHPLIQAGVQGLMGNLTSLAGVASSATGGSGGSGFNLGGINLGSMLGMGEEGGSVGELFGSFQAGMAAPLTQMTDLFAGEIAPTLMGVAASLGAVVPILGAAFVAYELLAPKAGGPKQAGVFNQGVTGLNLYPGEDTSAGDKSVQALGQGVSDQYAALMKQWGINSVAKFGLSYDTDPQGTAQNRISSGVMVNGVRVFTDLDRSVGRDTDTLNTQLDVEAKRMLLAALQSSNLPSDLAKIFGRMSASVADEATIDRMLAFASAVGNVNSEMANIGSIGDALDKVANSTNLTKFQDAGTAMDDLLATYDGTTDATTALAAASGNYYSALVALENQIKQVSSATSTMFAGTISDINLTNRDPVWLQNYYWQQYAQGMGQLGTATDPTQINAIAASINDAVKGAFGATDISTMSPEQQDAVRQFYMKQAEDANTAVQARLQTITDNAEAAAKTDLQQVHDAMMTAAGTMQVAADTMVTAANTPVNVNVSVSDPTAGLVTPGYGEGGSGS